MTTKWLFIILTISAFLLLVVGEETVRLAKSLLFYAMLNCMGFAAVLHELERMKR